MLARIAHVSDLHVGAQDVGWETIEEQVRELVRSFGPEVVVASGDLTHRNHAEQHLRAAAFLRSLGPPVVALPGNHDLPPLPPARVLAPFRAFLAEWPNAESEYSSSGVVVCGLNSVRPWRYQRGALSGEQLERVRRVLAEAPARALRAVALHHHLASPPWRTGKRAVPRRSHILAALAQSGAELVLGGHVHQSVVAERREFLVPGDGRSSVVLAGAAGLGRPRQRRRAETRGLQLIEADASALNVTTLIHDGHAFATVAERTYPRRGTPLR